MTEGEALSAAAARLAASAVTEPRREARLLLALALCCPIERLVLSSKDTMAPASAARFAALVERRAAGEPYSRILGRREFWSREFQLSADTLDPRPDSETLIEAALAQIADRAAPINVIDLGTGTGVLLLSLLTELPNAQGLGIDRAPGAVETARRNAAALGLSARADFAVGHWGDGLTVQVDVILVNPPYIQRARLAELAPEVRRYDPRAALDGGPDGLAAYRELAPELARLLRSTGFAVCEIGAGQRAAVVELMTGSCLETVAIACDLGGIERCLIVRPGTAGRIVEHVIDS
jgi:release factor glutamine methyltransferase